MTDVQKSRDLRLDRIRSGLILLVVFGHFIEVFRDSHILFESLYRYIYSFHMPAFVMLAGMTSSATLSANAWRKLVSKIIRPLIVFWIVYEVCHYLLIGYVSNYIAEFAPYWITWFLMSLVIWRLTLPVLIRTQHPLLCSMIIALGAGFIQPFDQTLSLSRTVVFLPFFVGGYLLYRGSKQRGFNLILRKVPLWSSLLWFIVLFFLLSSTAAILPTEIFYGRDPYSHSFPEMPALGLLTRIMYLGLAVITVTAVLRLFTEIPLDKGIQAKNSLWVYLWHGLLVMVAARFISEPVLGVANLSWPLTIAIAFGCLLMSWVICWALSSARIASLSHGMLFPFAKSVEARPALGTKNH